MTLKLELHIKNLLNITEKATSNLLLEPDWASIMQICDLIRQKDCQYVLTFNSISPNFTKILDN